MLVKSTMTATVTTLALCAGLWSLVASAGEGRVSSVYEQAGVATRGNAVDEAVLPMLRAEGIRPAPPCSDAVFIRRVYLDVIGTLPTAGEVRRFLSDHSPGKRAELIDQLLEREEFSDYWSLKWCDLLRVKSEFPINLWPNAVQAYHRWIRQCIRENRPYDEFVRQILTASGSNFRVPEVNFYRALTNRAPGTIAAAVALTFMGTRVDSWTADRRDGMAAFFQSVRYKRTAEWKEGIVYVDLHGSPKREGAEAPTRAMLPDGTVLAWVPGTDPRALFAEWLVHADNPWFARSIVHRIWYWLMGVGIIHEPDDVRPGNPPGNPALLALLERELVSHGFDLRHIYRLILNSATYQRSCIPTTDRSAARSLFAHYPVRRLDAEVLIDAICQITGIHEDYSSLIPEPWTFIPGENRSIALADGSITSPFLEIFGRPARATGLESERNNDPTPAQKLHLLNSGHMLGKLSGVGMPQARATALGSRRRRSRSVDATPSATPSAVDTVYLAVLTRFPTTDEREAIAQYTRQAEAKGAELQADLIWALINTPEFLYRH